MLPLMLLMVFILDSGHQKMIEKQAVNHIYMFANL